MGEEEGEGRHGELGGDQAGNARHAEKERPRDRKGSNCLTKILDGGTRSWDGALLLSYYSSVPRSAESRQEYFSDR